jgi:spermidine synthase
MSSKLQKNLKIFLFLVFALSGFCGLIYESIWTHYIKLILGHAAYAQTLVLSIFMGGLAAGAALTARTKRVLKNPLRTYAIVELIIGLLALAFHSVFVAAEVWLHQSLIPMTNSVVLIEILRWLFAAALILPQSILLGTTFPLIGTAIVRLDRQHSGSSLGMLYFSNSIGAAVGVLVSAFFLIGAVGLPGTILTAGLINLFLAIVAWSLSKQELKPIAPDAMPTTIANNESRFTPRWLLGIALLTGLASFFYEIAWIRMLSLVLGSSMQAFEIMLSAFIFGIALGGLWIRNRIEHTHNPALFLGKVQVIMGLFAVATLPLYNEMFDFMGFLIQALTKTEGGYLIFNLGSHFISLLIMLPATFMAGMTLPLITFTLLKWNQGESSIGRVYAFNTIGAIVGILLAVHIAMPLVGTKGLILSGAMIDVALGLFLISRYLGEARPSTPLTLYGAISIVVIGFVSFTVQFNPLALASGVYRYGESSFSAGDEVLYYQNGKTASISVVETNDGIKSIATNGKPDAAIYPSSMDYSSDEITMTMLAALPLAIHPQAQSLANIGLGSGLTTHTLLLSNEPALIDTIEIESTVVGAIEHFGATTENALVDPRSNIIIDDAKSFFSRNKKRYDVIVSEPSNPWVAGVSSLFSTEFYRHINRYLNDDGILVQWLHLYESNLNLIASVFNAIAPHFEDYAVYTTADDDIIIVASNGRDPTLLDQALFDSDALKQQLARVHINDISDIRARLIGNKGLLQPFFSATNIPANSDYFPTLGLYATKSRFLQETAVELTELHISDFPPVQLISPIVNNPGTGLHFMGDAAKRRARNISTLLLSPRAEQLPPDVLNDNFFIDMQEKVSLVTRLLQTCEPLSNQQQLFGNSLHSIAINTLPFIDTNEMQSFWSQLGNHRCLQSWPEEIRQWMTLYSVIGSKQYEPTITLARDLVADNITNPTPQLNFLIGATLTAYIKLGRYEQAQQFAYQIIEDAGGRILFPLYLKILFAQLDIVG